MLRDQSGGHRPGSAGRHTKETSQEIVRFAIQGRHYAVYACGVRDEGEDVSAVGTMLIDGQACPIVELIDRGSNWTRNPVLLLTPRELEIATLVAHGQCTKRIADKLRISEWTVQTHLRRIYAKLGVAGRAEMVFRCSSRLGEP